MTRRLWPLALLVLVACAAAAIWLLRTRAPSLAPSPVEAVATPPATQTVSAPTPAVPEAEDERPVADYDRYRREMRRIRAAREEAQALQDNERCIEGQRFRKVGSAWEPAGNC